MNKDQAVEFLKAQGMESMSRRTLERHTSDGRIAQGKVVGKTGLVADYTEEALLLYKSVEEGKASVVIPAPSIAGSPPALPPSPKSASRNGAALATIPFLGERGIERAEATPSRAAPKPAKELPASPSIAEKILWTVDEAVLATGASKGSIVAAVKAGTLKGGLNGGKMKVVASAARKWAEELF